MGEPSKIINIMVVDDSRIMRAIVKNSFLTLNIPCQFVEAQDGVEAMYKLKKNEGGEISLILLDWNMPRLSGIDFLKKVRTSEEPFKDVPIIMVTSEGARYNIVEALKNGATDYLLKPVDERLFREKIAKLKLGS